MTLVVAGMGYVGYRIFHVLPFSLGWRIFCLVLYILAIAAFFISFSGRLERLSMDAATAVYIFGNSWLIFFLYALMAFVLLDLLRLVHLLPKDFLSANTLASAIVFGSIAVLLTYGSLHYHHKYREEMTIESDKVDAPLKAVLISDLHLGYHNRRGELARWVDIINAEHPDLVLIAGDVIDRSPRPLELDGDAQEFHRLTAPVYACLGNHEYISGKESSLKFYEKAGIRLLVDECAEYGDIVIIGRNDASYRSRAALSDLVGKMDTDKFTILLDHQPSHLEEAQEAGIDFQFSGHTHHGQVWPISIMTDLLFENAYGPLTKGNTQYYVTSGLGLWGGKFRIGTRSEYLVLNIL